MKRKLICLTMCFVLLFSFSACKNQEENPRLDIPILSEPSSEAEKPEPVLNPFTGEEIAEDKKALRPVAVVINNLNLAQKVQTGVAGADIVYETEVEGGITRLLAVYKDISKAQQFGSIRSARVVFAELALSHDAIFAHCGIDRVYAAEYVKNNRVEDFDTNQNPAAAYAYRKSNGLSREHTVYSSPELLSEGFTKLSVRTDGDQNTPWCAFSENTRVPEAGAANEISVKFSSSYISNFSFDSQTGLYTKNSAKASNRDYTTKADYTVKNVFVLKSKIYAYSDGYHKKVELSGGEGYYFSAGGYEKITWKKSEGEPIKFFSLDGKELKVNKGNSWVCIVNGTEPQIS